MEPTGRHNKPTKVMNETSFVYTLRNALRPGYASVMFQKLKRRFDANERTRAEAIEWAGTYRVRHRAWCEAIDPVLAEEAQQFNAALRVRAQALRDSTGQRIGGGARAELLYFLTRLTKPETIVETGVAAGFSSMAFLSAIQRNGHGRLYSSDFPYFRADNPQDYVGILVPQEMREGWTLLLKGDSVNLPAIRDQVASIDFYHYDSDKSYAGRTFGIEAVESKLTSDAIILMDDIVDNVFFRDYVTRTQQPFLVFGNGEHCVGAINLDRYKPS